MHYYIYPKGRIGKTLGKMFEFLEMHDSYSFVDDYQEGITLNEQACDIKNKIKNGEAKVVIALSQGIVITTQRVKTLEENLQSHGINEYLGREFVEGIAIAVCKKAEDVLVKSLSLSGGGGALIGIVLYGLGNEKHLGNIDYELMKRGARVVYLDSSGDDNVSRKYEEGRAVVIPIPMDYFKHIYFLKYIFSTASTYTRNREQIFFVLHHSFSAVLEAYVENKIEYLKNVYKTKIDYLFETSRKMTKVTQFISPNKPILLNGGYAAFDIENDNEESIVKRDALLIALHDREEIDSIKEIFEQLLQKKIILFVRYRYEWGLDFLRYLERFKKRSNFFVIETNVELNEAIKRSFAIITSASSMAYTFPLKTLCPAILYFKGKNCFMDKMAGESFYDERLHLYATNIQDLISILEEIFLKLNKNYFALWQEKILDFRRNEVYHWKNASSCIADQILKIINKV